MEWLTIITTFLQPIILKCFEKTSAEDPQEFLRSNYNAATGRMNPEVVEDAIPATRRAVRRAHRSLSREDRKKFPRYTREELYDVAEKSLIDSMNAPQERVAAVRSEAAGLPDED